MYVLCHLQEIDVCSCGLEDLQFTSQFQLNVLSEKPIVALVGYFDIYFEKYFSKKVSVLLCMPFYIREFVQCVYLNLTKYHLDA